jgi:hypothetical protein
MTISEQCRRGARRRVRPRRAIRIVAALIGMVGLAFAGTVAIASASDGTGQHSRVHTIHIVTTLTSSATNSAGLGGPGDVVAQTFSFRLPTGASGHIDASVTLVSASEQLSHVAFVFPHGQIDAQAAITLPPTHFVAAITGGTEAYEGIGGQVVNTVISTTPVTIDRTLYLIYPDED